ncbi:MAG: putative porin [Prevotella sp.]|nr:putative porin [Prevotella sp.]MDY4038535.1 putative porin [Prevotella sp.]
MKRIIAIILLIVATASVNAQVRDFNQIDEDGKITRAGQHNTDSLGSNKQIPKGIKVWTVDARFGDIRPATPDTLSHMFMNSIFTTGLRGEFNSTGNLGAPRINRIYIDRPEADQFIFTQPYDFFIKQPQQFHFTNTLSPFTNLSYNNAGNRTNGEDHFTAKFGANAGKRIGVGFHFDYIYGRGYYSNQSTSHFNYTMYGSYLGDRYQAHLLLSTNHQKVTENGGITDDNYITHPESFNESYQTTEIPTVLSKHWNRNDNQHVFLTHRYSLGFNRKVPMTPEEIKAKKFAIESQKEQAANKAREQAEKEARRSGRSLDDKEFEQQNFTGRPDDAKIAGMEPEQQTKKDNRISVNGKEAADSILAKSKQVQEDTSWLKNEYVPVTSFIHTVRFDNFRRIYQAYQTPEGYFDQNYDVEEKLGNDSIFDQTKHYRLQNTFALSLLEGFNKWAKAGLKAFAKSDLRHFTLPASKGVDTYNEHVLSVGGQLIKSQGKTLHYNVTGELALTGKDAGDIKIDGKTDLNFRLFGDTLTLAASGFFHRTTPTFYFRHYHARHLWWDKDDLSKITHTRIEGVLNYQKTNTSLRVAVDELTDYTYFAQSYSINASNSRTGNAVTVNQYGSPISVLTASLSQNLQFGALCWESVVTYQKSTAKDVLPLPDLNIYTNLFLRFKIAHVLKCDFGADARYFTKYYAPDYSPALGQYAVQQGENKVEIGNYPIVNLYANFHLKQTRFFVMYSHVNAGSGNQNYFLTPHYPLNNRILRFGVSWNFYN